MTFQVTQPFYLLLKLLFQGLFSSSSGHHLQKPSNALRLKRSGFLHLSFMNSAGCATSLPSGSCTSSAPLVLWRAVSTGCRWCWVLQMASSSCCRVRTRCRVLLNTQHLLKALCWRHMTSTILNCKENTPLSQVTPSYLVCYSCDSGCSQRQARGSDSTVTS